GPGDDRAVPDFEELLGRRRENRAAAELEERGIGRGAGGAERLVDPEGSLVTPGVEALREVDLVHVACRDVLLDPGDRRKIAIAREVRAAPGGRRSPLEQAVEIRAHGAPAEAGRDLDLIRLLLEMVEDRQLVIEAQQQIREIEVVFGAVREAFD